jgi:hypothetical protein
MVAHESIKLVPIDSTITAVGSVSSVGLELKGKVGFAPSGSVQIGV